MGNNPRDLLIKLGNIPHMNDIWKTRLKDALDSKGLSMKAASVAAGKGETFVRDLFERDRVPSIDNFMTLAKLVGKPASYLLGEEPEEKPEPGLRRVEVAAHVQAGHWEEAWEWDEADRYAVFVPDLAEYAGLRLFAAEARGGSMNKRYPEGTVLVFNDVQDAREDPIIGKRYIVERKRASGEMEHTVKLLHADAEGGLWLMPESDDPRFQTPISVSDGVDEEDTVAIIGRVLFAVTRE